MMYANYRYSMIMAYVIINFVLMLLVTNRVYCNEDYGIRVKISNKGVNYFKNIANVLIKEANQKSNFISTPEIRLDRTSLVTIRGKFWRNDQSQQRPVRDWLKLESPNLVTWFEDSASTNFTGRLSGRTRGFRFNDQYAMVINDTRTTISLTLSQEKGRLSLDTVGCSVLSQNIRSRFYDTRKPAQRIIDRIESELLEIIQKRFEYSRCKNLRKLIDNLSIKSQKSETKVSIFDFVNSIDFQNSTINAMNSNENKNDNAESVNTKKSIMTKYVSEIMDLLKNLLIDFSMTQNPEILSDNLDIFLNGEISWAGKDTSNQSDQSIDNFNLLPNFLPDSTSIRIYDKMLYISVSDYVPNAILYHVFQHMNMNIKINRKTMPTFGKFLFFSCDGSKGQICLGSFFPEMAEQFYDHSLEIHITKNDQWPSVVINPGKATFFLSFDLSLLAIQRAVPKLILKTRVDIESEIGMQINDDMILSGNIHITKLHLSLLENNHVTISQEKLDQVATVGQVIVEEMVKSKMAKGVKIPPLRGITFIQPKIRFLNRKLFLETDIEMNSFFITKYLTEFLKQKNEN